MREQIDTRQGSVPPDILLKVNEQTPTKEERDIFSVYLDSDTCVKFTYPVFQNQPSGRLQRIGIELTTSSQASKGSAKTSGDVKPLRLDYDVSLDVLARFLKERDNWLFVKYGLITGETPDLLEIKESLRVKETDEDRLPDLLQQLNLFMVRSMFNIASDTVVRERHYFKEHKFDTQVGSPFSPDEEVFREGVLNATEHSGYRIDVFIHAHREGVDFLRALISSDNDCLVLYGMGCLRLPLTELVALQRQLLKASRNPNLNQSTRDLASGWLYSEYRSGLLT